MKLKVNARWDTILPLDKYDCFGEPLVLPMEIQALIDAGFKEEQGCILLNDSDYFGPGQLTADLDKCLYEAFLNNIHIRGRADYSASKAEFLSVALEAGKQLHRKLTTTYPDCTFRIMIVYYEAQREEEHIAANDECELQFHTIRPGCEGLWMEGDTNRCEFDAVLIME